MKCPACQAELVHCKNEYGNFWHCGDCGGTAVTLPLLKKFVAQEALNRLWRGAKDWDHVAKRHCPGCANRMEEVPLMLPEGRLLLDVCEVCQFVWMDAGEWDVLPNAESPETNLYGGLSAAQRERIAIAQVETMREEREREVRDEEFVAGMAGLFTGSRRHGNGGWDMVGDLIDRIYRSIL